ncbi:MULTISPECIES: hypothetical protein [Methylobacter]|jgi:hypothetical protein|uniref:hypothetical protein n=1 Tax=Methylobacter TaxID=429 RepID=UPI00036CC47E|nr:MULTISPECIES: hypothetical protein [Methylobacter]
MKKLTLILALAVFSPLSNAAVDGKGVPSDIAEKIEAIKANHGKVPANETATAVKQLRTSVREAVLQGLISRAQGSHALNGLENALNNGGGKPVSPS